MAIDSTAVTTIESSAVADVNTMVTNNADIGLDGDWNVTLSDSALSAAEVKAVNAGTSGQITMSAATTIEASSVSDILEIVQNTGATFVTASNYAVTLNDTSASAANIKLINADSSGAINMATVTTITSSSISDILEIVQNTGAAFTTASNYAVTLSDTSGSAANIATINADSSGAIDMSAMTTITSSTTANVLAIVENTGAAIYNCFKLCSNAK